MESLLARALESKLKYWLKSFTRDQFKLRGRVVQLCNLDINGDVLHASLGLPPTLSVSQARLGVLEIKVPPLSNVQVEPVVVEIDKLDLVLVERPGFEPDVTTQEFSGTSANAKSSGYGFADKIADGVTLQVGTVNLLLETRGGMAKEGASWTPPLAAITIRSLLLYTTNEAWQVVNLKEARDFSTNKRCIYVFKKLEWESLSVDLLPHPDMFSELTSTKMKTDNDGAKRLFFGGERFLDNISGEAFITMHRTELNSPLGLEVQVHVPEAICSALSEPGLRALLRFMTGMYVCMNRGDVSPRSIESVAEAAGRSMVQVAVDHIFLCIKDADFQLELLLQSLHYMRSSVINGDLTKTLSRISVGGLFLRDSFTDPHCTLVQPGAQTGSGEPLPIPNFASAKLWPRVYPISDSTSESTSRPMFCLYSVQMVPSPAPPILASQMVLQCQSLKVELQEDSCLRIASFIVDGVVVDRGIVKPATSVDSMYCSLKCLDLLIPVQGANNLEDSPDIFGRQDFTGARLHVEDYLFIQSPTLSFKTLELEKDPACFMLWEGQPIDASQRRWVMRAMHISVALENGVHDTAINGHCQLDCSCGLWRCIEMAETCIEAAMVTGDGSPILTAPPPQGTVRFGLHCKQLMSNTSVEQLFFVLRMYEYIGKVNDSLLKVTRTSKKIKPAESSRLSSMKRLGSFGSILNMAPSDTAVCLGLEQLELKFSESLSAHKEMQSPPLVQISGSGVGLKVTHRTLGGAVAIASKLKWHDVLVECVETSTLFTSSSELSLKEDPSLKSSMRPVFWISNGKYEASCTERSCPSLGRKEVHFLDIDVTNVIPYRPEDAECHSLRVIAQIAGIRLGGGMVYSESLLHRFGVLGPDGGPGKGLKRVLRNLSNGPLASLLKPPSQIMKQDCSDDPGDSSDQHWELGIPDEIDIVVQLNDWVFALEADSEAIEDISQRRERCWHSSFHCLHVMAQGGQEVAEGKEKNVSSHPLQQIIVAIEGLEFIKPSSLHGMTIQPAVLSSVTSTKQGQDSACPRDKEAAQNGLNVQVLFGLKEDEAGMDMHMGQWTIKRVKSGIDKPVEIEATKEEVEYLVETVKLEIEAASRMAAGLMQLLELQGSIGQATIRQLSSIGSGSLDRAINHEKSGRRSSIGSVSSVPIHKSHLQDESSLGSNLSRFGEAIMHSREACARLSLLSSRLQEGDCQHGEQVSREVLLLTQQLNEMEGLLESSRTQV